MFPRTANKFKFFSTLWWNTLELEKQLHGCLERKCVLDNEHFFLLIAAWRPRRGVIYRKATAFSSSKGKFVIIGGEPKFMGISGGCPIKHWLDEPDICIDRYRVMVTTDSPHDRASQCKINRKMFGEGDQAPMYKMDKRTCRRVRSRESTTGCANFRRKTCQEFLGINSGQNGIWKVRGSNSTIPRWQNANLFMTWFPRRYSKTWESSSRIQREGVQKVFIPILQYKI